jgi:long-chain acyl-CoA synthetase
MAAPANFVDLLRAAVDRNGDGIALRYLDGALSYRELDRQSDAFAAFLAHERVGAGERMLVCLQNVPAFVVALLGAAKAGVITVPINPMYRQRELGGLVADCAPALLLCHPEYAAVADAVADAPRLRLFVRAADRQTDNPAWLPDEPPLPDNGEAFDAAIAQHDGAPVHNAAHGGAQPLLMVYTSGTTGKPKGVLISHANLCAGAAYYRDAASLEGSGGVLGAAPLFHVTGLSGHIAAAIAAACPLVLTYRFFPEVVIDQVERHRPSFLVAAVTALSALVDHPAFARERIASLTALFSGGAPIPPALRDRIAERTGLTLRNVYGLTETSAPVIAGPADEPSPVDPVSGALAIGRPVPGADILLLGEDGAPVAAGEVGEIAVKGPSVFAEYWRKPEETRAAFADGWFLTGDMGRRDAEGWLYLVDRKKDMIVASGFKVWPRDVEDVIYTHPAVREAAVVGVADPYRGETVKAVVSLVPGATLRPEELIAHCRARMAAFKCPHIVEIVDDLPKTMTGKILRMALR